MADSQSVGTSTDDLTPNRVLRKNAVKHSVPMHDAHLESNAETTKDGYRVTDLIIELRDDMRNGNHFMPCPRNTKGRKTPWTCHLTKILLAFRPTNLFRVYELIGNVIGRYVSDHYIYPSRSHQYWTLIGFQQVNPYCRKVA